MNLNDAISYAFETMKHHSCIIIYFQVLLLGLWLFISISGKFKKEKSMNILCKKIP